MLKKVRQSFGLRDRKNAILISHVITAVLTIDNRIYKFT